MTYDKDFKFDYDQLNIIINAINYHDICYDPLSETNEEKSCEMVDKYISDNVDRDKIKQMIMCTKDHSLIKDKLDAMLSLLDLHVFLSDDIQELYTYNYNIFKEYQMYSYLEFKEKRLEFLKDILPQKIDAICKIKGFEKFQDKLMHNLALVIDMVKTFRPKIGIYAGSFNPFHKGHYDILKQAELIFDKVIVLRINDKVDDVRFNFISILKYKEYINSKVKPITRILDEITHFGVADYTLIRGIRNGHDLLAESNFVKVINDMGNRLPVIHVLTKPENQHISSTIIRELEKLNDNTSIDYLTFGD